MANVIRRAARKIAEMGRKLTGNTGPSKEQQRTQDRLNQTRRVGHDLDELIRKATSPNARQVDEHEKMHSDQRQPVPRIRKEGIRR